MASHRPKWIQLLGSKMKEINRKTVVKPKESVRAKNIVRNWKPFPFRLLPWRPPSVQSEMETLKFDQNSLCSFRFPAWIFMLSATVCILLKNSWNIQVHLFYGISRACCRIMKLCQIFRLLTTAYVRLSDINPYVIYLCVAYANNRYQVYWQYLQ